jgi:hypothetical protein
MVRIGLAFAALALVSFAGASRAATSGADTFRLPSGKIYCAYEHYSFAPKDLRCEIRTGVKPLPPKPSWCDVDWGAGYAMRQIGFAHVLCVGDTIYDPKAKVLAYWTTWTGGGFSCTSRAAGLRCTNPRGHGFFLSKEHSYAFTEAASRNGAFKTPSGNIVCGWSIGGAPGSGASIECGIKSGLKPPPQRVHCAAGDPNDKRISLTATRRAVPVTCAGDPGPFLVESKAAVLGYGKTWAAAGISCASATNGLTCKNRSGHGFFLSRQRWRRF